MNELREHHATRDRPITGLTSKSSDSEKQNSGCQQLSACGVGSCSSIDVKFGKLGVQQFTCI